MEQVEFYSFEDQVWYAQGLDGLAELLGCSKRTAQNIKTSGKIDKAVYQEGRMIIIDADKAIELLR